MSSSNPPNDAAVDRLDEQLVAYLDGELEGQERRDLEERLMEDPESKRRLRALQQSFDLLEELPRSSVNKDFARTTVEMVAFSASQEIEIVKKRRPWKLGTIGTAVVASTLITFCIGALVVRARQEKQQSRELQGLAVAENLRAYSLIKEEKDFEFFSQLAADPLWQELIKKFREIDELPTPNLQTRLTSIPVDQRMAAVDAMTPENRSELRLHYQQFDAQESERQAELLRVARQVETRDDAERLLDTLVAYVDCMDRLSVRVRSQMQTLSDSERLEKIREFLTEESERLTERPSKAQIKDLYDALIAIGQRRFEQADPEIKKRMGGAGESQYRQVFIGSMMARRIYPNEWEELAGALGEEKKQELLPIERRSQDVIKAYVIMALRKYSKMSSWDTYQAFDEMSREWLELREPASFLRSLQFGPRFQGMRSGDRDRSGGGPGRGPGRGGPGGPGGPGDGEFRGGPRGGPGSPGGGRRGGGPDHSKRPPEGEQT